MPVVINGSTGITTPDGSASVPPLAGTTSSTAGVLYPAANVVAFSTNSVERLRVPSTGGLQFNGSSSGGTVVQASATASGTLTLPATTGTVATTGFSVAMALVLGG